MNKTWIPYWVLVLLPKSFAEPIIDSKIQNTWDNRSNGEILDALVDANEWIRLSKGIFKSDTMDGIANDCQNKLDEYILPQMKKRGLFNESV